ncbi:hypothetical protein Acr_04g0003580 [Actinidia rufa]|uniref:DUF4283 domain-containing protein n=1 Tax=Actinidia rufa TaxID=165716 RepID=A0A7J0EGW6_9ERIC|nr:hypothetical protein Acr_04g0003580 [Actinidia rufa]
MAKGKNKQNKGGQGVLVANAASTDLYESDRDSFGGEPNSEVAAAVIPSVTPAPELPTEASLLGVRPNAIVKIGSIQGESSAAGEERDTGKAHKDTKSYASLIAGNRMPLKGSQLQFFDQDEGRFPGKQVLKHITNSWKVQVSVKHYGSGRLIFQFSSADDKSSVLENGPYIIYGRPLLLKAIPRFFRIMGHTQEGCKANKSNKDESAKPADKATKTGKETWPIAAATDGQTGTSGTGTNKGNQLEWTEESTNTSSEHSMEAQVEWEKKKKWDAKGHIRNTVISVTEEQTQLPESSLKQTQGIPIQHQEGRRPLWENLNNFNASLELPWLLLGDFNNILSGEEKVNGLPVTTYGTRDFRSCCYDIGISDLRSTGVFHTWTNNSIGCKLDKAMVNFRWIQDGLIAQANFGLPEKHSDYSPCVVSLFARAKAAEIEFLQAQQNLYDNPSDINLQNKVPELRVKANRLAEAELSFCSQLAKAKYLKNRDKGTKFFHDLIKSNKDKNQIISLINEDGVATTSPHQASSLFVDYYKNLLGTKTEYPRMERVLLAKGLLVQEEQSLLLICPIVDEEIKTTLFGIGDDKAPGPDGFTACFFKKSWSIVGQIGDITSVRLSIECLKKFGEYSRLRINNIKSNVFMAGINREDMEEIKAIIGLNMGTFPFRYLGIPVAASKLTIEQFNPLISRISKYISAWAGAILSYTGRSELIRSVLQEVQYFWLSILPIPMGVRDKVIALCRNFLWGGKTISSKKSLVA